MNYNKEQVKSYLIDCVGYSEEDLKGYSLQRLLDTVEDHKELKLFTN